MSSSAKDKNQGNKNNKNKDHLLYRQGKEIEENLSGLQINKARGPEKIGYIVLKKTPELANYCKLVSQTSLNKGKFST